MVDIAMQATADASRLVEVAKLDEKISGQMSIEAGVKGAVDALTIDAQLRGSDVQVRELIDIDVDAAATYQLGQDQLRVSRLRVSGPVGSVSGDGQVALRGAGPSKVNASVEGLNAEPLMRSLQLPYRLATRVDGRIDAEWPGLEYQRAVGNARLVFTPTAPAAAESTLALGGRIDVSGGGARLNATLRDVRAAGAVLNGQVALADRQQLNGTVAGSRGERAGDGVGARSVPRTTRLAADAGRRCADRERPHRRAAGCADAERRRFARRR